jgi:hypothetical protein
LATAPTQPYLTYPATDLSSPWLDRMAVQIVAYDVRKPPIGLTSSGDSPTNRSQVLRGAVDIPVPALRAPLSGVQLDVRSADGGMLSPVLVALIDPQGREAGRATRRVQTLGEGWASWVLPTTRIDETGYRIRITEASPITVASSGARPSIRWLRPTSPSLYPIYGDDLVIYRRTTALPRARFTARWRVGDDTVQQLANESSAGPVVLDRALPGVTAPSASSGSARIVVDRPDTVTIESRSTGPGLVVLADTYGAGWRATVDGRAVPIARADRMFRAVAVGAGEHRVTFTYRPKSFERGAAATAVGLLALAGLAAAPAVRRRLGVPGASV